MQTSRDSRGRYVPVVMVHGWTGKGIHDAGRTGAFSHLMDLSTNRVAPVTSPRSLIGQLQRIPGAEVFVFDYHRYSARWVTDEHLGPQLGKVIDCLYAATGEKVILVGHSMGGLLARYAASGGTGGAADRSGKISSIATFGTPHAGSAVAQAVITGVEVGAAVAKQVAVLRLILAECGAQTTRDIAGGSVCDTLPAFVAAFDSAAGRALRSGSRELTDLKPFPKRIAVHAVAGDTQLAVPGGWFALPWQTTNVPMGDMIVTTDSAAQGASTSKAGTCGYQLSAVRGATDTLGLRLGYTSRADVAAQPLGAVAGACFHTSLMRTVELTNEVTGVVNDDITARQPLTESYLLTAPVPALCQHPAGRLVDGALPGLGPTDGYLSIAMDDDADTRRRPVLQDLTGDGTGDAAAVISCSAGGVSWPDTIVFYGAGAGLLGAADLTSVQPAERATVDTFVPDGSGVRITWTTTDGCCFNAMRWTARAAWDGTKVRLVDSARVDTSLERCAVGPVEEAMCGFLRAVTGGDLSRLSESAGQVAASVTGLPDRQWELQPCELEGDVTVRCDVVFPVMDGTAASASVATFYVAPANGEYFDGQVILPPGEKLRYEVVGFEGVREENGF